MALFVPGRHQTAPAPLTAPTPLTAQQVMDRLIDKAGRIAPVPVPKGQLLYVRTVQTGNLEQPSRHTSETWFDGETIMPQRIRVDGKDTPIDPGTDKPGSVAEDNRNIVARGGNWYFPTAGWLADVPTDPAALLARLDKESFGAFTRTEVPPQGATMHLAGMLSRSEPRLSPELRVGLYRLIAGLAGLTVTEATIDGRRCWAVGQADEYGRSIFLLFDAETGHVVGQRHVGWGEALPPALPDRTRPAPTPPRAYDPERDLQSVWTFAVVPDTDRTE